MPSSPTSPPPRAGQAGPSARCWRRRPPRGCRLGERAGPRRAFPGLDMVGWFAVVAPAGTPQAAIDRFNKDLSTVLAERDIAERMAVIGPIPEPGLNVERVAAFLRAGLRAGRSSPRRSGRCRSAVRRAGPAGAAASTSSPPGVTTAAGGGAPPSRAGPSGPASAHRFAARESTGTRRSARTRRRHVLPRVVVEAELAAVEGRVDDRGVHSVVAPCLTTMCSVSGTTSKSR